MKSLRAIFLLAFASFFLTSCGESQFEAFRYGTDPTDTGASSYDYNKVD